jgi:hypothetical protein
MPSDIDRGDRIRVLASCASARDGETVEQFLRRARAVAGQRYGSAPEGRERVPFLARAGRAALWRLIREHARAAMTFEAVP